MKKGIREKKKVLWTCYSISLSSQPEEGGAQLAHLWEIWAGKKLQEVLNSALDQDPAVPWMTAWKAAVKLGNSLLQEAVVARGTSGIQRGHMENRCPGGDQVQIPRCNLSTDDFLSKERVAKGTVTPATPCSSNSLLYWTSEGKYTEPHRFCTNPGLSCMQVCLSKKWHCSCMTPSPSARMGQSFQPWCMGMATLRMHSHPKLVFWGMEAEKAIPRQLDARVFQYPLIQALISKLQKH